jgi:RNA polymerase sigma factor (sigma-70 family)
MPHAAKQPDQNARTDSPAKQVGFQLPEQLPAMPVLNGPKALLTAAQEQSLGYRIIQGQLDLLGALAVDTKIVEELVDDIWEALGEKDNVEKAVALVFHQGAWLRAGSIPRDEFAALARLKLNSIRSLISELRAFSTEGLEETLFTAAVRDDLRARLGQILPYDFILNRAADKFRVKCKGLSTQCRELVKFISDEVRIPRAQVEGIVCGNWTSPKLIPALLMSGGYELKLYPPAELKRLRLGITERQGEILRMASSGEAPAGQLLAAWAVFARFGRDIEACVETFVKANMRLVESYVNQYRFSDVEIVRSAASMGLVRAVYRFAPEMGFKFSNIAVSWIRVSILRDLNEQEMIRLPEGSHQSIQKLKAALNDNPSASHDALVAATGLSSNDIENLMYLIGIGKPVSLDSSFQEDGATETDGMHEMIADPNVTFESQVIEDNTASYLSEVLDGLLDARELLVVTHRFGLGGVDEKTLGDVAVMMGLSKERVRQIQCQALAKLRDSEFGDSLQELWEE